MQWYNKNKNSYLKVNISPTFQLEISNIQNVRYFKPLDGEIQWSTIMHPNTPITHNPFPHSNFPPKVPQNTPTHTNLPISNFTHDHEYRACLD